MVTDTYGLYDIYGMRHVPFWQRGWFIYSVVALVVLMFGMISWLLYRYYKKRMQKPKTSWEIAHEHLMHCRTYLSNLTPEHGKEVYGILTKILKNYLHNRFTLDVYGKTDEEMLTYLMAQSFPTDIVHDIQAIVRGSTEIKFAHGAVLKEQLEHHLNLAHLIINRTIPTQ